MIEMKDLENRRAYRIQCRNLLVGFWDAEQKGFLGVREKFGDRYLFTEYHYDTGAPHGTAHALEALDLWLPEDVELRENLDAICFDCGERAEQVWEEVDGRKICTGNVHLEETDCQPANRYFTYLPMNLAAFALLDPLDQKFEEERRA